MGGIAVQDFENPMNVIKPLSKKKEATSLLRVSLKVF